MIKIAINGFGRIGRITFRRILEKHPELEVVAINDLAKKETLVHLLKYDSLYGICEKQIEVNDGEVLVDNKKIKFFFEPNPEKLPWKELGIDVVLECTGHFRSFVGAKKHLEAGAKKVIISALLSLKKFLLMFWELTRKNMIPKGTILFQWVLALQIVWLL